VPAAVFFASAANAESLQSMLGQAALLNAMAPMYISHEQATTDVALGSMNQQLAEYKIDRYTDLSLSQAQMAYSTTMALANMQVQMNALNQGSATQRLQMQLDALQRASQQNYAYQGRVLDMEYGFKNRLLDTQLQLNNQQFQIAQMSVGASPFVSVPPGGVPGAGQTNVAPIVSPPDRLLSSLNVRGAAPSNLGASAYVSPLVGGSSRTRFLLAPTAALPTNLSTPASNLWPRHTPSPALGSEQFPTSGHTLSH
jgi:hypothetical protein